MSQVLTYTLSLNDQISGKLQKIGVTSDSALNVFSKLEKQASAAGKVMGDMGRSVGSLQQKVALLKQERDWIPATGISDIRKYNTEIKKLEAQINKLQTINGSRFKHYFKDALAQMPGSGFFTNPLVAIGGGIAAISKLGIENERTRVTFEVLLGSEQKAADMLGQMNKYAAITPYQKSDLQDAGKVMLGFGIAQDKIMPNLKMVGDIAMGDANKMQSLTLAFSQIQSTGKLMGQDLLQLINGGFNPLQEMSRTTGHSMAALKASMEKGQISAQMVEDAFRSATEVGGKFHGMTEKIGQTVGGRLSTLIDNLKETALKLFEVIGPILSPALDLASSLLGALAIPLGWLVSGFTWLFGLLRDGNIFVWAAAAAIAAYTVAISAATIVSGAVSAATAVWTGAQWLLNAALTMNPVGLIVAAVVALIAVIGYVIYKTEGWGSLWSGVVGFMKYTFLAYVEGVKLAFSFLVNGILKGIDLIKIGWYKFKLALGLGDAQGNRDAIAAINAQAEARQKAMLESAKKVADYGKKAKENLGSISMKWDSNKSLGDMVGGIKKKLGMGVPENALAAGQTPGGKNPAADKTTSAIATGGARNTSINITLKNLVESITFSGSLSENRTDMERQVTDTLLRVLYAAQSAG